MNGFIGSLSQLLRGPRRCAVKAPKCGLVPCRKAARDGILTGLPASGRQRTQTEPAGDGRGPAIERIYGCGVQQLAQASLSVLRGIKNAALKQRLTNGLGKTWSQNRAFGRA